MPETIERFTVFLASPGDVPTERKAVAAAVDEINRTFGEPEGFVLTLKRWETHTRPATAPKGGSSQDVIDAQIGPYDVFVGLMWTRFGTPTKKAGSGTEQEYEAARKAGRRRRAYPLRVMFYFRSGTAKVQAIDPDQLKAVRAFRAKVFKDHLAREYDTPAEFARLIREHLTHEARALLARKRAARPKAAPSRTRPEVPALPPRQGAKQKARKTLAERPTRGPRPLPIAKVRPLLTDAGREAFARKVFNSLFLTISRTVAEFRREHAHASAKTTRDGKDAFEVQGQAEGYAAVHFRVELAPSGWRGTWHIALRQASPYGVQYGGAPSFQTVATVYTADDEYTARLSDSPYASLGSSAGSPPTAASVASAFWVRINAALSRRR